MVSRLGGRPGGWLALGMAMLFGACGDGPITPSGELPMTEVVTSHADDAREWADVAFVLRNKTDRTLFLRTHCAIGVERRVDGGWQNEPLNIACTLALQSPIWLAVNEPYYGHMTFPLLEGWQGAEFRLRFDQFTDALHEDESAFGDLLPLEFRVSSTFRIEAF